MSQSEGLVRPTSHVQIQRNAVSGEVTMSLILAKPRLAFTLSVFFLLAPGALYSQQSETTVSVDAGKMQELLNRID